MNAVEIREKSMSELQDLLKDKQEELFNLRFKHAINQLDNPMLLVAVKKDIARIKTIIREIELNGEQALEREEPNYVREKSS